MMNAKTPAEREALMAEHMKSMQGGMDMMKRMGCMAPMGGQACPVPTWPSNRRQWKAARR